MNTSNSFGFVILGIAMAMFPVLMPQAFPPSGLDGSSTRALWLSVVGCAQLVIGFSFLIQIWVHRLAATLATIRLPGLDRSPAPATLNSAQTSA